MSVFRIFHRSATANRRREATMVPFRQGGLWMVAMALCLTGCSGNLTGFIGQNLGHVGETRFRAPVVVSPSQTLTGVARQAATAFAAAKEVGDACTLYSHVVRSQPGYSVRELSDTFLNCILTHGAAQLSCDFEIGHPGAASDDTAVEIPVTYTVSALSDATPGESSSWVAEAAWQAIPKEGSFTIRVPARAEVDGSWKFARLKSPRAEPTAGDWRTAGEVFSAQAIRSLALAEAAVALATEIEPTLRKLVNKDGLKRFEERRAVYGIGVCALEVAPQEDGIDTLAVLSAAQQLRDGKHLPRHLVDGPVEEREEVVDLARKVCGMMSPKTWKSTQREQLQARPVFISKTSVVLELAPRSQRLPVSRNAFTEEGEQLLARMEQVMGELVARLNASALRESGLEPAEVEARWRKAAAGGDDT